MKDNTKITLSVKELELVCNTDWILTKQIIIQKVYNVFGLAAAEMQRQLAESKPELNRLTTPKISKGENYRQLPYVILDYPRLFTKEDTAAIRTFFWWGNFCSVSVQLAGKYKAGAKQKLLDHYCFLSTNDYFICVADAPWEHHFEKDNIMAVSAASAEEFTTLITSKPFVKIAKKIPLEEWENMHSFILKSFKELHLFL